VKINSPVRNLHLLRKDLRNRKNAPSGRFRKPQLITVPKRCLKRNPKNQENNKRRQRLSFCFQDKQFPYFVKMLSGELGKMICVGIHTNLWGWSCLGQIPPQAGEPFRVNPNADASKEEKTTTYGKFAEP
jgi:hypothetical protein